MHCPAKRAQPAKAPADPHSLSEMKVHESYLGCSPHLLLHVPYMSFFPKPPPSACMAIWRAPRFLSLLSLPLPSGYLAMAGMQEAAVLAFTDLWAALPWEIREATLPAKYRCARTKVAAWAWRALSSIANSSSAPARVCRVGCLGGHLLSCCIVLSHEKCCQAQKLTLV